MDAFESFSRTSAELIAELARFPKDENVDASAFIHRLDQVIIDPKERKFLSDALHQASKELLKERKLKKGETEYITSFNSDEFGARKGTKKNHIHTLISQGAFTVETIAFSVGVTVPTVKRCINDLIKKKGVIVVYNADGTVYSRLR